MRFRLIYILALIIAIGVGVRASNDSNLFASEQVYLAPTTLGSANSDSLRIEGIVTCIAGGESLPYSKYVYVEVVDETDSVVMRQKIRTQNDGRFATMIPTDDLIPNASYFLRCYTQLMRNFSPMSFGQQAFHIGNSHKLPNEDESLRSTFSTPGDGLQPGFLQYLTAVVYESSMIPKEGVGVVLLNSRSDTVTIGKTSISGMAQLAVIPEAGEKYKIAIAGELFEMKNADHPSPLIKGNLRGKKLVFEITSPENQEITNLYHLFSYDRSNGLTQIELKDKSGTLTLAHPTRLITLFLINKNNHNLAAETSLLNSGERRYLSVTAPQTVKEGDEIIYEINGVIDSDSLTTIARFLSCEEPLCGSAEEALIFRSELISPLPFPERYALADEKVREADLRAWLSTARFSRFNLAEMVYGSRDSIYRYMPEVALELKGRIENEAKRPMREGNIVAYNTDTFEAFDSVVGNEGRFCVEVADFIDGTEFFLQAIDKKGKPENQRIILDDTTYPPVAIQRPTKWMRGKTAVSPIMPNSRMLDEVVVKARKINQNPTQLKSKSFYGYKGKDREAILKRGYITLVDILRDLQSIEVAEVNGAPEVSRKWRIHSRRGGATVSGNEQMALVIDGEEYPQEMYDIMLSHPASDIESVEVLTPAEAIKYAKHPIDGAVYVVTRSHADMAGMFQSKGVIAKPFGLTSTPQPSSKVIAPSLPGKYILQTDIITPSGEVRTLMHPITVTD